ncbi:unnamed protein product [Prorocentrum cordatum]|uniref:Pseudouridine synthase RsuA/RluA-like domain-containing protein n=1 Tax=Prorocentrum cordatum TaxID=2364126 RepID=A0ABN9Y408_9DINO|nr:unnamed protein product [Polarella glacialis]
MPGLADRVAQWNRTRAGREENLLTVLHHCQEEGWAVVNKPAGMETTPEHARNHSLVLQAYLPALLPPPPSGAHRRGPRPCHRLDHRVSGPVVVATGEEACRSISRAFAERTVQKEYRALVCGRVGAAGDAFTVDEPVGGRAAQTEVSVLRTADCPHCGALSELALRPRQGRYRQLRLHCAEVLGAPIVNEDEEVYVLAEAEWRRRHAGAPLPRLVRRGKGSLFLQAVEVAFPPPRRPEELARVRVPVAERFGALLRQAQGAWDRGWRGTTPPQRRGGAGGARPGGAAAREPLGDAPARAVEKRPPPPLVQERKKDVHVHESTLASRVRIARMFVSRGRSRGSKGRVHVHSWCGRLEPSSSSSCLAFSAASRRPSSAQVGPLRKFGQCSILWAGFEDGGLRPPGVAE